MSDASASVRVDEAQARILEVITPLAAVELAGARACGRVLASDVRSLLRLPEGDVSVMDGFAIRSSDLAETSTLEIVGESAAGHPRAGVLSSRQAARISTGALVPDGADAVVAIEDCDVAGERVTIDRQRAGPVRPGHFVRAAGSDVEVDALVGRAGELLTPGAVALIESAGHVRIPVHRPPKVAILCSGDELVPVGAARRRGQIVSTNGAMLARMVEAAGGVPDELGIAPDRPEPLIDALARGLAADVLVTSGGISVGVHDLVLAGLTALGLSLRVRKVALRPGRPLTFGIAQETPVFALPGNPASTLVAFELFVRPALAKLSGLPRARWFRPEVTATLTAPAPATFGRDEYLRARVEGSLGGPFLATPLTTQVSGALRSISGHNALLVRPARSPAAAAGAPARALLLELPDPPGQ
ncbi:MAG: molybdopterin molybdotransferase MoeA [Nannocystaceae bacterium]